MTAYPEARRVVLTRSDLRRLTILERARATATVGARDVELRELVDAVAGRGADPAQVEQGVLLMYAMAWQLELRLDRSISWEEAQTWNVALDLEAALDPVAEAEAEASVQAALATGLPPDVAGDLSLAQLDAYRATREAAEKAAKPRRVRRARR